MGATQVAEGPLIKHVPGGYAEWRAKESGLPPARLHSSEGEWWGKLVGPTDTLDVDAGLGTTDTTGTIDTPIKKGPDDIDYNNRIDTIAEITAPSKMWDDESIYALEEKLRERLRTTPEIGLGLTAKDLEPVKKPQTPQALQRQQPQTTLPKPELPAGSHPQILLPTKFKAGPIGVPAPADDIASLEQGDRFRFFNEPAVKADIASSANDVWNLLDRGIKWVTGPTAESGSKFNKLFGPRNENERRIFGALKDWLEISGALRREIGDPLTGGTLFETKGGKTTPRNILGEDEPAHFWNLPKTLWNFIQGKEHPVVMQEYGDLHLVAIVAHAALAAQYGPMVWAAGGIQTLVPTIIDAINGATLDKPNLEGNYAQDAAHLAFWVLGNSAIKIWKNTVGKITEKIRENPEPKTERETLIREFEKKIQGGVEYLPKLLKELRGIPPIKDNKIQVTRDPELSGLYRRDTRVSSPFVDFIPPGEPLPGDSLTRVKKFPTGQPTAIPVIEDQPVIYDKDEVKGHLPWPIAGKVQGELVDEDPRDRQMADERDRAPSPEQPKQPLEGDPGGGIIGQEDQEPVEIISPEERAEKLAEKTKEIQAKFVDKWADAMIEIALPWASKETVINSLNNQIKVWTEKYPGISVTQALYLAWLGLDVAQKNPGLQEEMREILPVMFRDFAKENAIKAGKLDFDDELSEKLDLDNLEILDHLGINLEGLEERADTKRETNLDNLKESLDDFFDTKFSDKEFNIDRELLTDQTFQELDAEGRAFEWSRDEFGNFKYDEHGRLIRDYGDGPGD